MSYEKYNAWRKSAESIARSLAQMPLPAHLVPIAEEPLWEMMPKFAACMVLILEALERYAVMGSELDFRPPKKL